MSATAHTRRMHRRHIPRSYHARQVADLTVENWGYDVELTNARGRSTLLRRGDQWYDEKGILVAASDDIEALYLPAAHS